MILDVTKIEPKFKHPRIFEMFDDLKEGESVIIINDHDPKPLYYQMLAERGNVFSWEYLEDGPATWKVCIARLSDEALETVGEIAARELQKAAVFKKYGIDFCCGGKKILKDACMEKGVDVEKVKVELRRNTTISTDGLPRFQNWSLDFLIDYIVNNHHSYTRQSINEISPLLQKVVKAHHENHPELYRLRDAFDILSEELVEHMDKEEQSLFPGIRKMIVVNPDTFELKEELLNELEDEHQLAGQLLGEINKLTRNFTVPDNACASYRLLLKQLAEFEADVHQHIHLENNILFSKAKVVLKGKFLI